jgi:undecaprenyl pyrophosphate phosphatase UppP
LPAGSGPAFAVGVIASFASTLASTPLIAVVERDRTLLPFAAYRAALGTIALRRLRRVRMGGR